MHKGNSRMFKIRKPAESLISLLARDGASTAHSASNAPLVRGLRGTVYQCLAVIALAIGFSHAAQAVKIDFEEAIPFDLPTAPYAPLFGNGDEFYQGGFWLDPFSNSPDAFPGDLVGALVDGSDLSTCFSVLCPANNATKFYTGLNDGVLAIGRLDSLPFLVNGFDASFVGASGDTLPPVAGLLRLQGIRADTGGSISQDFLLNGPQNGELDFSSYLTSGIFATTPLDYFFAFGFACDATGLCSAFSSDKGQFALDNVNITVIGAVPEPATWLLVAVGLVAVGGMSRRRPV